MMTAVRFECPQCARRVEAISVTETPFCKGPADKRHMRPVKMVPTDAAPRRERQPRATTAAKKTTGMIKRRQR